MLNILVYFLKMGKPVFLYLNYSIVKQIFVSFSLFLAFKQSKGQISFQVQPLKMLNNILFAYFRVTVRVGHAILARSVGYILFRSKKRT